MSKNQVLLDTLCEIINKNFPDEALKFEFLREMCSTYDYKCVDPKPQREASLKWKNNNRERARENDRRRYKEKKQQKYTMCLQTYTGLGHDVNVPSPLPTASVH